MKPVETKKRVVIYSRVSTSDQTNENQIIELRRFCENNNYKIVAEYSDVISGVKSSRPALDKMLQEMRNKKFDTICVWKFDRLGRSTKHLLQVLEEIQNKGVKLIATSQNIDTSTSMGKLFFTILSGFAEMERELMIERVNLSIQAARKKGRTLGRPNGSTDKKRRCLSGYYLRWARPAALAV